MKWVEFIYTDASQGNSVITKLKSEMAKFLSLMARVQDDLLRLTKYIAGLMAVRGRV